MKEKFNPLEYKTLLSQPRWLSPHSLWREHIPFGMWLIEVLRPRLLVELGAQDGDSYLAFCQAVQELGLPTRCYSINTWQSAVRAGERGPESLAEWRRHHDLRYATFSTLMQSGLDDAIGQFPDGAIDVLHIDGACAYDEVKQALDDWLPKMSERGVILMSGTSALDKGLGARQLFDEIKGGCRHFELLHGDGLGLLLAGSQTTEELEWLTNADGVTAWRVRRYFHQQGQRVNLQSQVETKQAHARELELELKRLREELAARLRETQALHNDLNAITGSRGWRILQLLWKVRRLILPSKPDSAGEMSDQSALVHYKSEEITALLSELTDEEWLEALVRSVTGANYKGIELPGFPSEEAQKSIVGASGEYALREIFNFYRAIKSYAMKLQSPITPDSRILDFGCGWGRITRFFLKDIRRENIFGVDVMPEAIEICRQTKAQGNFILIDNHPPLDLAPESFDLIYAYSVFSHLAEAVSLEWLQEFSRLLKPDGLLVVTTYGRWFIEFCRSLRDQPPDQLTSVHAQFLANSFLDTEAALADYDQGKFLFSPTGGAHPALSPSTYGETFIPPAYVGRVWTKLFSFRGFIDDPAYLPQALIVMQKTSPSTSADNSDEEQNEIRVEIASGNSGDERVADSTSKDGLVALTSEDVRLIAFYLPQFHPIPENDLWWGKGFTEWIYVARAKPNFEGHHQPRLPADLGFYDLRVPETREQQAELAREYGIFGFCYYHYWFGGRKLLHRPFDEVLKSGKPDFPFCICWANENWSRRWDGLDQEILIAQAHSPEDDRNFITNLLPAFRDKRYIRVNGKPLLLVYRTYLLPNAARTAEIWREECRRAGIGEIYLCALEFFANDLWASGFDAAVEFPPHGLAGENLLNSVRKTNAEYTGKIVDYVQAFQEMINKPATDYALFRGVMPSWDNTPRRQNDSLIFLNSSPEAYESWLRKAIELTITRNRADERIVFINAWNEWAEGAHLEPDQLFGLRYLEATRNAIAIDSRLSNLLQR